MTDDTRLSPTKTVSHATPPLAWSCEERDRMHCRNPHSCHCREIDALIHTRDRFAAQRDRAERNRDMWKGQCERQAAQLTNSQRPTTES